jgi:transposase
MQGRSIGDVNKSLGIGLSMLDKWVPSATKKTQFLVLSPTLTADQKRLRDLEKENALLREVNVIRDPKNK